MNTSVHNIPVGQLSLEDRLTLIDRLMDSLPTSSGNCEIPEWHVKILDERIAEDDANPEEGITLEQFEEEVARNRK